MDEDKPVLLNQSMRFINLMFWFFAIVGMGIIVWNFQDELAKSIGNMGKFVKKMYSTHKS